MKRHTNRHLAVGMTVAAISLATACSGSKGAEKSDVETPAGEPVSLQFAWPTGQTGTMQLEGTTTKDGTDLGLNVTYTVTASEVEDGTAVSLSEARDISMPGVPETSQKMAKPMIMEVPTTVFRDGDVVGIKDFEAFRDRLLEAMEPAFEVMPELAEQMKSSLSPEVFLASARGDWEWRGTAYHGKSLVPGQPTREEVEFDLVFVEGKATGTYVTSLEEFLPCPGAEDRQCVRLKRVLKIEEGSIAAAVPEQLTALYDDVEIERSISSELIADPDTLLPYRLEKEEFSSAKLVKGPNEQSRSERKSLVETYTWQ